MIRNVDGLKVADLFSEGGDHLRLLLRQPSALLKSDAVALGLFCRKPNEQRLLRHLSTQGLMPR